MDEGINEVDYGDDDSPTTTSIVRSHHELVKIRHRKMVKQLYGSTTHVPGC